ncbi:uncharacterized protein PHALS_06266 [Plasmopara halstedii]|uniref:PDZ domain n=1 Tax=Plasmopara halstedii TaxID=4781 RepID=A0A0P1B192_PLAHL|nr:uncharacterized protein PHALS_06266 [Plasmopara halstedii]CEG48446.1 hypothetical protein PHALS_06266 [Plasmopara halstedii]|eukprot:XP_024584815.1 hypothetical protein PHALS_06266 [Plasmopara halstedii]
MAHDGSSDDDSSYLDTQESADDETMPLYGKSVMEVEMSPLSSPKYSSELTSQNPIGRPKATSAAAAPISSLTSILHTVNSDEIYQGMEAQRRTQSESNLRIEGLSSGLSISINSAIPVAYLTSPAHSESALTSQRTAPSPPSISVRPAADTKPSGFMTLGGTLLAGMADLAGLKSPKGTVHRVYVVYSTPGPLFVDLYSRDDGTGARVRGFRRKADGSMADTEASGRVYPGDELVMINAITVTKMLFSDIITAAKMATFPLTLVFHCYSTHREEFEKNKTITSKQSNGPLPPMSPSSSIGWGARLNQMTRSGSFDQKTSGLNTKIGSPSHSSNVEPNGGKFGFSLGADGVKKNIFRIIGNKPARPEEDVNIVRGWMNDLALKPHNNLTGGRHRKAPLKTNTDVLHSTPIVAVTTGGRFVGVLDDDQNEFALTWFRKTPIELEIQQIKGVTRCPYFPSVDDVGAIICLQCVSLRFPQIKRIVEMPGPLVLDPAVGDTVNELLEAGAGSFSATLASNEHDSFQIKISSDAVTLVKISEDEDEGGVIVKAIYSSFLQVLLDPADQLRFTLKVQEFGGLLGNREGDVCDLKNEQTQLQSLSCFFLVAQNRQNRDIMTLLIRKCRARVISFEQEEEAQSDERNLFMDPSSIEDPESPLLRSHPFESDVEALSPVGASGETASDTDSPGAITGVMSSPLTEKSLSPQGEEWLIADSDARLIDLVGLEPEDFRDMVKEKTVDSLTSSSTLQQAAMTSKKSEAGMISNGINGHDSLFVEGRLAAQDREMAMLRKKITSVTVLLKLAEQENKQVAASLEIKDNRIELQQQKLRQLEKLSEQCTSQAHEISVLRTKLKVEEMRNEQCQKELQQVLHVAANHTLEMHDQVVQTEAQFFTSEGSENGTLTSWERDAQSGTVARVDARDLQQQIQILTLQLEELQEEQVELKTERNMFRAKSLQLSKELRKLMKANDNCPLDDIAAQLAERRTLEAELAVVKASAKRTADELNNLKSLLVNGDKDKGAKRLAAQIVELQRKVLQLQDSLNESRDQNDAVKRINTALASRLHQLQPETRGSIVDLSAGEDDEDDGEDDDDEEDEELTDGIAAFRRSLVRE